MPMLGMGDGGGSRGPLVSDLASYASKLRKTLAIANKIATGLVFLWGSALIFVSSVATRIVFDLADKPLAPEHLTTNLKNGVVTVFLLPTIIAVLFMVLPSVEEEYNA